MHENSSSSIFQTDAFIWSFFIQTFRFDRLLIGGIEETYNRLHIWILSVVAWKCLEKRRDTVSSDFFAGFPWEKFDGKRTIRLRWIFEVAHGKLDAPGFERSLPLHFSLRAGQCPGLKIKRSQIRFPKSDFLLEHTVFLFVQASSRKRRNFATTVEISGLIFSSFGENIRGLKESHLPEKWNNSDTLFARFKLYI